MQKKYSTTQIEEKTFTEENWKAYFQIRTELANKKELPLISPSWQALKQKTLLLQKADNGIYMLSENNQIIGYFSFLINLKEEANRRYVYFRKNCIKDLDKTFFESIYKAFMLFDPLSKFLVVQSINGQYDFLEQAVNAEIGDYVNQFELKIKDAKTDIINTWYKTYSEKFKDFQLRHYEDIPDNLLEEYCTIFLELLDDMPDESKISDNTKINPKDIKAQQVRFRKSNSCSYRYLVFDGSKLIAKTNVSLNKSNPQIMYQYMTGVTKNYRKRGMGKWLKAAMFLKLVKDFPELETIKTEVHAKNIASKKLSMQMGYEKTGHKKEYLISKTVIEKLLEDKS